MCAKEIVINEATIDLIYVYGDEDSALFRIVLTKNGKNVLVEDIACPLQTELFKDGRWHYHKGNIPIEQSENIFQKLSINRFNKLENFYKWKGTTAHHPAMFRIYLRSENNEEFKKEIYIEDYPLGVKNIPESLSEIMEIGKLLQDQTAHASEKLPNDKAEKELELKIVEIDSLVKGSLKYFSSQAIKIIREK